MPSVAWCSETSHEAVTMREAVLEHVLRVIDLNNTELSMKVGCALLNRACLYWPRYQHGLYS